MSDSEYCRDAIDRFLDRSWMLDRTPLPTLTGNRVALHALDTWLQRHRVVTLTDATASDVRALLRSAQWDAISRRFEALLGLVTRFYRSLQDSSFRADDPIETLIDQELAASVSRRKSSRAADSPKPRRKFHFSRSPVI
jgi:site-specific recombinase XerD